MESNVQPSFIPKKPVSQPGVKPQRHTNLFSLITTILFVTVVGLAITVFALKFFANRSIESRQVLLDQELQKFDGVLVRELSRLDTRIVSANELIKKHLSTTGFFAALGDATLKPVKFSSFLFTATDAGKYTIGMQGKAQSFAAVALQLEEFKNPQNSKYFKDVQIINPDLAQDGTISFNVSAGLDTSMLTYPVIHGDKTTTVSSTTINVATTSAKTATSTTRTRTITR